jgi:hypothetical protein
VARSAQMESGPCDSHARTVNAAMLASPHKASVVTRTAPAGAEDEGGVEWGPVTGAVVAELSVATEKKRGTPDASLFA